MNKGRIITLQFFTCKGDGGTAVPSAECLAGMGMLRDFHADGGNRQITLLSAETIAALEPYKDQSLCYKKFKANIITEGLDFAPLKAGDLLTIGNVKLQITGSMKHCYPEDCALAGEDLCQLTQGVFFTKVIQSGTIILGESVCPDI